jgi:hypothetical protein
MDLAGVIGEPARLYPPPQKLCGFRWPVSRQPKSPAAFDRNQVPVCSDFCIQGKGSTSTGAPSAAGPTAEQNWALCQEIAMQPRILDYLASELERGGLVGEERAAKLVYQVLTSRLLKKPICSSIKGPSSAGKNCVAGSVLRLFPATAYYRMTSMSPRLLAYSEEPLVHRILVLEEAAGLGDGIGAYLMRSLISEGRVRHETVTNTADGFKPLVLEREGPTGLLVTTTSVMLEPELETRMFSIPVTDAPAHTHAVLAAIAAGAAGQAQASVVDPAPWHALQLWIEGGPRRLCRLPACWPPPFLPSRCACGATLWHCWD